MTKENIKEEILQKYLRREQVKKRGVKKTIKQIIREETQEESDKRDFLKWLKRGELKWLDVLFSGGYAFPPVMPTRFQTEEALNERKRMVKERYHKWKFFRPYLRFEYNYLPQKDWFPPYQWSIFQFLNYKVKRELITDLLLFHQMIMNYLPFYEIYQYDCVPGKGYQWYSGEAIILYYITEELKAHPNKIQRLQHAFRQKKANGYDLKDVYKVIICTFDWKKLDLPLGTGKWKLYVFPNDGDDFRTKALMYWRDTEISQDFLREMVVKYAATNKVLPWPYYVEERKFLEVPLKTTGKLESSNHAIHATHATQAN